jgi:hypothetical protein
MDWRSEVRDLYLVDCCSLQELRLAAPLRNFYARSWVYKYIS